MPVDLEIMYFLNGFIYQGKDVVRDKNLQLGQHVIMKLIDPFLVRKEILQQALLFTLQKL